MATNPFALARKAESQLKASNSRYLKKRLEWSQPYPVGLRVRAIISIRDGNWSALSRHAAVYRREAMGDLAAMNRQRKAWAQLADTIEQLSDAARRKGNWVRPNRRDDWAEVREGVIRGLRKRGLSETQARQGANAAATTSLDDLLKFIRTPLDVWARQLEVGATTRLSTLAAADTADAVARFNQQVRHRGRIPPSQSKAIANAPRTLEALLKDLQRVFRGERPHAIQTTARHTRMQATKLLDSLVLFAAHLARPGLANVTLAEGREALRVASALRLSLFTISASRVVEWTAAWPQAHPYFAEWQTAARTKPFKSAYRAPSVAELAQIARTPSAFEGKYLSLEGTIGPVVIVHRGEKAISSTSISDGKGAVVSCGIPHIKLDSGGMVPGSFAIVTGTFRNKSAEFPAPCLILDRRNLTDDSRESWVDWLTLQMLPILAIPPHALCAVSSWKPGPDGPGNPLRYGTWSNNVRRIL
jgi:hypothetical protein